VTQVQKLLRSKRKSLGIPQAHIARQTGVLPQFYYAVEKGTHNLPKKHYKKVLKSLHLSRGEFERALVNDFVDEVRKWM